MNFISRAIANTKRRLSKTILLILTFFLIGNFVVIGLGVNAAASNAKILTRKKMNAIVKYNIDFQKYFEEGEKIQDQSERDKFFENSPKITIENIKNVVSDSRVKTINIGQTDIIYTGTGLKYVPLDNEAEKRRNEEAQGEGNFKYIEPNIATKGNIVGSSIEFEKTHRIIDGRFYNQDEIDNYKAVVVISKALADLNGLKVSSKIMLRRMNASDLIVEPRFKEGDTEAPDNIQIKDEELDLQFEVIGIYEHDIILDPNSNNFKYLPPFENPDNTIFLPAGSISKANEINEKKFLSKQIEELEKNGEHEAAENLKEYLNKPVSERVYISEVTILLNDPLEVDSFVEEYTKSNTTPYLKVTADNEDFLKFSKPLDTISLFANLIIWLVVINAVVIISLVTALTLKTREYEIGVLLSIGASKLKVILQFFVELALIATLGFTLSAASGAMVSGAVGQKVLDYTVNKTEFNEKNDKLSIGYDSIFEDNFTTKITLDDVVSEYHVNVSPVIILVLYIIGLSIVLISVLIPSVMIMRFNPKKILMMQN